MLAGRVWLVGSGGENTAYCTHYLTADVVHCPPGCASVIPVRLPPTHLAPLCRVAQPRQLPLQSHVQAPRHASRPSSPPPLRHLRSPGLCSSSQMQLHSSGHQLSRHRHQPRRLLWSPSMPATILSTTAAPASAPSVPPGSAAATQQAERVANTAAAWGAPTATVLPSERPRRHDSGSSITTSSSCCSSRRCSSSRASRATRHGARAGSGCLRRQRLSAWWRRSWRRRARPRPRSQPPSHTSNSSTQPTC